MTQGPLWATPQLHCATPKVSSQLCPIWNIESQVKDDAEAQQTSTSTFPQVKRARAIFERAYEHFKNRQLKDERMLLLEAWQEFETEYGTAATQKDIEAKLPKRVKKRRQLDDGTWEEYFDYLFPDDQDQKPNLKLLDMAHQWKQKMEVLKKEKSAN